MSQAIADYEKAVGIGLQQAFLHDNLAIAYLQAGRTESALSAARHAAALDPAHEGAHYSIVEALVALGRYEEAIDAFRLGEAPRTTDEYGHANNLAWLLYRVGEHDRALPIIEEFFGRDATFTGDIAYEADTYAHILSATGDEDKAVRMFLLASRSVGQAKVAAYRGKLAQHGIEAGGGEDGLEQALRLCVERASACRLGD